MHKKWTGKEIRLFRESLELTQAKFAQKIHTDVGTVSRWERGKFKPSSIFNSIVSKLASSQGYDSKNPRKVRLNTKTND